MANIVKKALFNLMEKALIHEGSVLAVSRWEPADMIELVLHLPTVDMSRWTTIPRIKCKVGEFEYRDYTPATWDAEDRVCNVFIETGHKGSGSLWTKSLNAGDQVFFGPAHAAPVPSKEGPILCLGDGSALGHFLALKQLTREGNYPLEAAVHLNEAFTLPGSLLDANPEFEFLVRPGASSIKELQQFAGDRNLADYASVYIAGHIPMVQELRKKLKQVPGFQGRIFGNGFWS